MSRVASRIMSTVLLAALIVEVAFASVTHNCDMYGKLALKQAIDSKKYNCGFRGKAWGRDLKDHVNWCASVDPTQWRAQLKYRRLELQKCKI
ncbi:MAG: hypothetical protein HRT83_03510 [Hyphomicrobiaceae bacterium]|nr:hypothetical protein [Hyphomicrobiaceae bacterium]